MSEIFKFDFNSKNQSKVKDNKYGNDWPVVYILKNEKEAYVGETTNAFTRFKQHSDNPKRTELHTAYLISDEEYNKSAALDIESSLIQYLAADNKYQLQNGNGGLLNHSYYDRQKYQAKFELIWEELKALEIAKHDLIQLRNTDLFKYSPYKSLTEEQILVVEDIFFHLQTNTDGRFIINGGPGTGKTILAVYLVKYLKEQPETRDLKIALVVPMSSLRSTLKKVFRNVKGLSPNMVIGPADVIKHKYDLLLVDETHRLRRRVNITNYKSFDDTNAVLKLGKSGTELDWIVMSSRYQIFFYDENQTVRPGDIRPEQINRLTATHYELQSQLRVQGGEDYIEFVNDFWNLKRKNWKGKNYEFKICENIQELKQLIDKKEKEVKLSRLVAGYAWPWQTKSDSSTDYDIEIDGMKFKWNSTNIDWVNSINAVNEVGCIHTVQGYDLNYVGVIIGPEVSYDAKNHRLVIDPKKYFDMNGKRSISDPEELERYIVNIYKTLMTRGIQGTYIYATDPVLSKFLFEQR